MKNVILPVLAALLLSAPAASPALTLEEGLAIVVENSREVSLARAEQATARGGESLARAPWLPSVDLYGRETWLRYQPEAKFGSNIVPTSQDRFPTYGVRVTQLVYDFGRTTSSLNAARALSEEKDVGAVRARNHAAIEFIFTYLDFLEAEKLLQVADDEVKLYEAHEKDTQARYAAGVITKNEVLQAGVTLADSRQRRVSAENLRSVRASQVNSLLLRPLSEKVEAGETTREPGTDLTLEDAWRTAEAENPELRDLDARVRAKQEANSAVRAEYFPSVYVTGGYEYLQNQYMVRNDNWSVIAGINLNLFSGGATRAKLRMGEGELNALTTTRERVRDQVRLDVQRAYLDLDLSRRKADVAAAAVAQAEENHRIQRLRYEEGVGTATDVLDAVTLLTTAKTNVWKARYGIQRAEAALLYSVGKDLASAYGPPTSGGDQAGARSGEHGGSSEGKQQ